MLYSAAVLLPRFRHPASWVLVLLLASQLAVSFHRWPNLWSLHLGQRSALAELPADAMVIISSYEPLSYHALWMADALPLVRIRANFMRDELPVTRHNQLAVAQVGQHEGPLYLLAATVDLSAVFLETDMARLGLDWGGPESCSAVFSDPGLHAVTQSWLCPLERCR